MQLENTYPEDKSLSPIEMSIELKELLDDFCRKRGLVCKFEYLISRELNQELISRIKQRFNINQEDLATVLGYKSERGPKIIYYSMVYAILEKHQFGITNKKQNKLRKISYSQFAEIFHVDRKTIAKNINYANFYRKKNNLNNNLKHIFYDLEKMILN